MNWKRLALEAVAIIGSILLAFAIDAWWDARKERVLEQEALHDLRAEYEDHKGDVSRANARHLGYLQAIDSLLEACRQGAWLSDEITIDQALFAMQVPETVDLGNGVRDTLVSSGKLDILLDRELRYELAEWDSVLYELTDDQLNNTELVLNMVLPYLVRKGLPMSGPLSNAPGQEFWSIPTRSLSDNFEMIADACADSEFISMVELRYGFMTHAAYEFARVLAAIDSMLVKIEASLTE